MHSQPVLDAIAQQVRVLLEQHPLVRCTAATAFALLVAACGTTGSPSVGTQTHWLQACELDDECGSDLQCVCGVCTTVCEGADTSCALDGASCIAAEETGAIALCRGTPPSIGGLCLPRCESGQCPSGTACVAQVCVALPEPTEVVTVDASVTYQTLVGIGAGIGPETAAVAEYPDGEALYDAMFAESGFEALRLFNQYEDETTDLTRPREIVAAAAARIGREPTVLLSSASPPAALKASGSRACSGNPDTCTLVQLADGTFDYAGFANHWRTSLEAYAAAGVTPDYISIQNDPNWIPPSSENIDACGFLPTEGTTAVNVNGTDVDVEYPGYDEALTAVVQALEGLSPAPMVAAPEATGVESTRTYAAELDLSHVDAIAHHMYGSEPDAVDHDALRALDELGQQNSLPIFQTEMQAEGLDTAILAHHALSEAGASVYLQNTFVWSAALSSTPESPSPLALIALTDTDLILLDPYYALSHYARDTEPGWVRLAATADQGGVLATAWQSPDEDALTVVIVNPEPPDAVVELAVGSATPSSSRVSRTVFSGVERFAALGELPASGIVVLPGESIVTVALQW